MIKIFLSYLFIKTSQLFDTNFYLRNYKDVRQADVDPVLHFVRFGWKEGRNPSELFDVEFYLLTYQDVRNAGINPLEHYILHGYYEGRKANKENKDLIPRFGKKLSQPNMFLN